MDFMPHLRIKKSWFHIHRNVFFYHFLDPILLILLAIFFHKRPSRGSISTSYAVNCGGGLSLDREILAMEAEGERTEASQTTEKKIATALAQHPWTITTTDKNGMKALDLSSFMLDHLPPSIFALNSIVKLDLSNNNLELLPEEISILVNLVILDVHSNRLTSLPLSIGKLVKLKNLNVSGNLLSALPHTIEDCTALEELRADFNELDRLPETMGFELIYLRILSASSNKLSYLPGSVSHMTSLRLLDVHLNKLRMLPEDIGSLTNLENLNVASNFNSLVALPESIGSLYNLRELDLSYNQISALPDSFGGLEKLQQLNLEGNPLVAPPPKIVEEGAEAVKQFMAERWHLKLPPKGSGHRIHKNLLNRLTKGKWGMKWGEQKGNDDTELMGEYDYRSLKEEGDGFGSAAPRSPFRQFLSPRRFFSPRHTPSHHHLFSPRR